MRHFEFPLFFFFFWHHSQNLTFGYWSHSFQTAHIDSSRTAVFLEVLFERPDSRRLVLMTSRHQDLYIWLSLCFWWEESNVCRVFIRVKDSFWSLSWDLENQISTFFVKSRKVKSFPTGPAQFLFLLVLDCLRVDSSTRWFHFHYSIWDKRLISGQTHVGFLEIFSFYLHILTS